MQVSKSLSCPFCCIRVLRGSRQLARCCLTNRFSIFIGRTGRHEPDKLTLLFLELLPACNSLKGQDSIAGSNTYKALCAVCKKWGLPTGTIVQKADMATALIVEQWKKMTAAA